MFTSNFGRTYQGFGRYRDFPVARGPLQVYLITPCPDPVCPLVTGLPGNPDHSEVFEGSPNRMRFRSSLPTHPPGSTLALLPPRPHLGAPGQGCLAGFTSTLVGVRRAADERGR